MILRFKPFYFLIQLFSLISGGIVYRNSNLAFSLVLLMLFANYNLSSAQIKWTEWKPVAEDVKVYYRVAFAKIDESNMSIGYYVEFKNELDKMVIFNFGLNKTNSQKETRSKVRLKAATSALLGIHYTDISDPELLKVIINDLEQGN